MTWWHQQWIIRNYSPMQDTSKGKMAQSQIQEGMTLSCTWRQMACLDPERGPGTCPKWNWTSRNRLNVPCESLPQVSSKFKAVGTILVHNVCPRALTLEIALSTWNPGPHYAVPGLSAREEKSHWSAWGRPLLSRVQCPDGGSAYTSVSHFPTWMWAITHIPSKVFVL